MSKWRGPIVVGVSFFLSVVLSWLLLIGVICGNWWAFAGLLYGPVFAGFCLWLVAPPRAE